MNDARCTVHVFLFETNLTGNRLRQIGDDQARLTFLYFCEWFTQENDGKFDEDKHHNMVI